MTRNLPPGCPEPPTVLTGEAVDIWYRRAPALFAQGRLTERDRVLLAGVCGAEQGWVEAERELQALEVQPNPNLFEIRPQRDLAIMMARSCCEFFRRYPVDPPTAAVKRASEQVAVDVDDAEGVPADLDDAAAAVWRRIVPKVGIAAYVEDPDGVLAVLRSLSVAVSSLEQLEAHVGTLKGMVPVPFADAQAAAEAARVAAASVVAHHLLLGVSPPENALTWCGLRTIRGSENG